MAGGKLDTTCGGVHVIGTADPWLIEQDARAKQTGHAAIDDDAERRTELIRAYYEQRQRACGPRIVPGTSDWLGE